MILFFLNLHTIANQPRGPTVWNAAFAAWGAHVVMAESHSSEVDQDIPTLWCHRARSTGRIPTGDMNFCVWCVFACVSLCE